MVNHYNHYNFNYNYNSLLTQNIQNTDKKQKKKHKA